MELLAICLFYRWLLFGVYGNKAPSPKLGARHTMAQSGTGHLATTRH